MTSDQRLDEIATILAAGFLRLRRRPIPDSAESSKPDAGRPCHLSESSPLCQAR
jgi:hypothetical protein